MTAAAETDYLLQARQLTVRLPTAAGTVQVVDGIDFAVKHGEVSGIAGESGSGKTVSMLAVMGLLPFGAIVGGAVLFGGRDLLAVSSTERRSIRGREIALVLQDPRSALHPMLSIETQMTEHMRHHLKLGRAAARERAVELLTEVRIPDPRGSLAAYPHQFSGGMRQRIAIAMALACSPKLLIADEPTTGLDVTVQASILRLFDRLRVAHGLSLVLITHDLAVLSALADRVTMLYAGRVVESGPTAAVLGAPRHPYTRALLDALPQFGDSKRQLVPIPGAPGSLRERPGGCAFHPRCKYAVAACRTDNPPLRQIGVDRLSACPVDPWAA